MRNAIHNQKKKVISLTHYMRNAIHNQKKKKELHGFSPLANHTDQPSDRRLSEKLVPTLTDRVCCVVSATNPHGR
jgi:hypothetical protein